MTFIVRKENFLVTDSLVFNGRPNGASLEYENKIKRNRAGTVVIVSSSNTFKGNFNSLLETISNIIYSNMLQNKEPSIDSFNEDIKEVLLLSMKQEIDISCMFCTKFKSYLLQVYLDKPLLLTYDYNELVYIGSGAPFASTQNLTNVNILELMEKVIKNVPSCGGTINTFDLNLLKDIVL